MEISSIKQQAKRTNRYSVYVDGDYAFSLSETALLDSKLVRGQRVTSEQVEQFRRLSNEDKLYAQALRYVALRLRSTWEVEQYLLRKQAAHPLTQSILNKLSDLGMLDDEAYAKAFVRDKLTIRSNSRRKISAQLMQKRVTQDVIDRALSSEMADDARTLPLLIARKRRQSKYQDDQKLLEYLARQGFKYDDIRNALEH